MPSSLLSIRSVFFPGSTVPHKKPASARGIPQVRCVASLDLGTLWLFNIAMENGPFIDYVPMNTSIYKGFSMAMLNNQMVLCLIIATSKPRRWLFDCSILRIESVKCETPILLQVHLRLAGGFSVQQIWVMTASQKHVKNNHPVLLCSRWQLCCSGEPLRN